MARSRYKLLNLKHLVLTTAEGLGVPYAFPADIIWLDAHLRTALDAAGNLISLSQQPMYESFWEEYNSKPRVPPKMSGIPVRKPYLTIGKKSAGVKQGGGRTYISKAYAPRRVGVPRVLSIISHKDVKTVDVPFTNKNFVPFASTPLYLLLNGTQQGSAFYNRIGNKMSMKSVEIAGFINYIATSVQDIARIILVYDAQSNGVAPTYDDVCRDVDQAGSTSNNCMSHANSNNR